MFILFHHPLKADLKAIAEKRRDIIKRNMQRLEEMQSSHDNFDQLGGQTRKSIGFVDQLSQPSQQQQIQPRYLSTPGTGLTKSMSESKM